MEEKKVENNQTQVSSNNQEQQTPEEQHSAGELPQPDQKTEIEFLMSKIEELEKQAAMHKDLLLRKAAEFENYKRRTEADALNITKYAAEHIILQLLPILDDLSRSLKNGKEKLEADPFYKGVELIYSKFMKVLEAQGVKVMETVGKEFNVDYHDALMQVPKADVPPHTIIEEVEKGYLLHDKVLRHAKVIVSSPVEEEVKN